MTEAKDNKHVKYLEEKAKERSATLYKILAMWADRWNRIFENLNNRIVNLENRGIYDEDLLKKDGG